MDKKRNGCIQSERKQLAARLDFKFEKELLLQRGYSYRIMKAEYRANTLVPDEKNLKIWVEVIPK